MFRLFCASVDFSEIAKQCLQINGGIKCDDVLPSESTHTVTHEESPNAFRCIQNVLHGSTIYSFKDPDSLCRNTHYTHARAAKHTHIFVFLFF